MNPIRVKVTRSALVEVTAVISSGVLEPKVILRHQGGDQDLLSVRAVRLDGVGVKVDRKRVVNRTDKDFLVERIFTHIVGNNPPVAPTNADCVLASRVVGRISVRVDLNVLEYPGDDVRNLCVGLGVHRVSPHPWAGLTHLVDYLSDVSIELIDGQAGSSL